MKKIDISNWKSFYIKDIFNIKNTNCIPGRDIIPNSGKYPYVTASSFNNGVTNYVDIDPTLLDEGNCVFLGGKTLIFTYQKDDFASNDSHNIALYLKNPNYRIKEVYLFLIVALKASLTQSYKWSDSVSFKSLQKDRVTLPCDINGNPDFDFMKDYIERLNVRIKRNVELQSKMVNAGQEKSLKTEHWKEINITNLFEIVKGSRLTKKNMKEGVIPFIGASAINNGVTAYIANNSNIHPGNTITVAYNGSVGEAFYQKSEFWASDDVNILYPKFRMTQNIAMFLIPILKRKGQNFDFIEKWNKKTMEKDTLLLPVKANGEPDFEYMNSFIGDLKIKTLTHLQTLIYM